MIIKDPKTGIQLTDIRLVSSLFEWPNSLENVEIEDLDVDLAVRYETRENFLDVFTNVCLGSRSENTEDDFYLEVEMLGVFEKFGIPQLSDEEFAKAKGAAIIFPYIRQHIQAISLSAGFTPIILPSVKFHTKEENVQAEDK